MTKFKPRLSFFDLKRTQFHKQKLPCLLLHTSRALVYIEPTPNKHKILIQGNKLIFLNFPCS